MNNEFNNQNMNQFQDNNMNNDYSNNYNNLNNQNNKKGSNGLTIALILIIIALAGVCLYLVLNKEDTDIHNKLNYEIRSEIDSSTGAKWFYLYLNDKKVNNIKAYEELGSIEVKEFNDLLIVDEQNPGPSRRLFAVDKNGNATEIDYKVSTYNEEFINSIDSYRIEGNNLYIKVNRQWGNGYIDWYCRYEDKNEVAEYEVKYEYSNGKFENKQVLNEVTIANKYKNEQCMSSNNVCHGNRNAVYHGEYNEKNYNINTTLTLNADGTFFQDYKNSEPIQGTYTLSNNKLTISHCPSVGSCDGKLTSTHEVSSDCSIINWGDYNLHLK